MTGITGLQLGSAQVRWTSARHGHLGHNPPRGPHDDLCCGSQAQARRQAVHPTPWISLTQVHGCEVLTIERPVDRSSGIERPGSRSAGEADALVTNQAGLTLAIAVADCGNIALAAPEGVIGAVHAGWAGARAGVIAAAVARMRELGASTIQAAIGPSIHGECYEFGETEIDWFANRWGSHVRNHTATGTPALDMPAVLRAALHEANVAIAYEDPDCTACSGLHFSYRATGTTHRQVMLVWR